MGRWGVRGLPHRHLDGTTAQDTGTFYRQIAMRLDHFVIGLLIGFCLSSVLVVSILRLEEPPKAEKDLTKMFHGLEEEKKEDACPLWPPPQTVMEQQQQVLLLGFHPEKTAGSTIARFLEAQEEANGGNFEMMSPYDEVWFLRSMVLAMAVRSSVQTEPSSCLLPSPWHSHRNKEKHSSLCESGAILGQGKQKFEHYCK